MTQEKEPGNKPEPEETEKPFHLEVAPGDRVRIRAESIIDPDAQTATPIRLFKLVGWPNDFLVLDVYEHDKYGQVITLDPCCNWVMDPEKHQVRACTAHTTRFFEVIERAQQNSNQEGRRYAGINIAGKELLSVEYGNGKDGPSLAVHLPGRKPVVLHGESAHVLSQLLRAQKVF